MCYRILRIDGYPSASVAGAIVAYGTMGCWTQTSGRKASLAEYAADDAAAVELALRRVYPGEHWRRYSAVLIARRGTAEPMQRSDLAGHMGLTERAIDGIVRAGMRGVRVELAARGLVPMPMRSSGWGAEARRRAQELCDGSNRQVADNRRSFDCDGEEY